jgi:4-hydroxybenzoate polyprenyltransferase
MKDFLKLIRWQNLLIVAITMFLIRYAVMEPLLHRTGVMLISGTGGAIPMELRMPWYDFIVLVTAVLFITAAGYVINDYFDIKTDLINRGKVIVGTKIPRRKAMMWHSLFNLIGVAAGFYVSWRAGYFLMGVLFLIVSGLLYFYSASYKRQFLIGNIIVALLTAMVPFIVIVYEWPFLTRFYNSNAVELPDLSFLFYWVAGFSLFAFLTTLAREIIKDIEDFEGDTAHGRNTLPIVIGVPATKIVVAVLLILTVALLYFVWYFFVNDIYTLIFISFLIAVPLLYNIYLISVSTSKQQLHRSSSIMKLVMLSGILYPVVVKVLITWNLV